MNHAILDLARAARKCPGDGAALDNLVSALRKDKDLPALVAIIECWASVISGAPKPALALSLLYSRLATREHPGAARKLCLAALDLAPESIEALDCFEQLAGQDEVSELCERYRAFLAVAPFHPRSPRIRVRLIDRLVEAGRYDEALEQVESLPPPSSISPMSDDIERACSVTR